MTIEHPIRAVLRGGRYAGWQDWLALTDPPQVVTVAWCPSCHRQHLVILDGPAPDEVAQYWLDVRHWEVEGIGTQLAVYRHFDPDGDLAATVEQPDVDVDELLERARPGIPTL